MNDFFENGIISEIDDKIINYLRDVGEHELSYCYIDSLCVCRNSKEQESVMVEFFTKRYKELFAGLSEDIKNIILARSL